MGRFDCIYKYPHLPANTDKPLTTILLANMTIIEDIILFKAICLSTEFFMLAACSPNNLCRISILLDFFVEAMK
jgi:hypothetical protein